MTRRPPSTISRRALLAGAAAGLVGGGAAAGARRIVSIGGAVTEILYRLGFADEIVGVDSTSQFPAEALKAKANVGYMRALGAEGILSLAPTLILMSDEAGPPDVVRILEKAGPTLIRVPADASAEGVVRRIEAVARALSAEPAGLALAREVETGFERLKDRRGALTRSVRALFILSIQNGKPLVGGRGTAADAMLALAGADNAASALEGWKPMSDEGVIAAAPDVLVTMDRGPGGAPPDPFALPAFAAVPAARRQGLVVMDGLYLLGFGPRTPAAALDLMAALAAAAAPEVAGQAGSARPR